MLEFMCGFGLGAALILFVAGATSENVIGGRYQAEAIERGYALYCPTTGKWAWKGECEE